MSVILSGCPHIEWNDKKNCEVCSITGKPTGSALMCDFDYDTCNKYKKNLSAKKSGRGEK